MPVRRRNIPPWCDPSSRKTRGATPSSVQSPANRVSPATGRAARLNRQMSLKRGCQLSGDIVGVHMQLAPLICVRDVESSSRWYQRLLGCESGHGGSEYERLNSDG